MADPADQARALAARGYRRTSNRHRIISRIDRPDWLEKMARDLRRAPADFMVPGGSQPQPNWCDHYRRIYSRDKIEGVAEEVFRLIPGSDWDPIGYVGDGGPKPSAYRQAEFRARQQARTARMETALRRIRDEWTKLDEEAMRDLAAEALKDLNDG